MSAHIMIGNEMLTIERDTVEVAYPGEIGRVVVSRPRFYWRGEEISEDAARAIHATRPRPT